MSESTPIVIIEKEIPLSCFAGLVTGSLKASLCDQQSDVFPVIIMADTNLGKLPINFEVKGNELIQQQVHGVIIDISISDWRHDSQSVSFHAKAVAEKFLAKCTIVDEDFNGKRHDIDSYTRAISDFHLAVKALSS